MKKLLKVLLAIVVVTVIALVAALAAHPLWVGPLVKTAVTKAGPKYTGTPIVLTDCVLNLYDGHFELAGFELRNPEGCPERAAASVDSLKVDFDTLSALSDVVNIRSLEVSGIFVSYVPSSSGKYNLNEIADNAKEATGASDARQERTNESKAAEKKPGKKVVIDRLAVSKVSLSGFGMKATLIPGTVVLTDVGKKSNGATFNDVWSQMVAQVMKSSGAVGQQLLTAWAISSNYGKSGIEYGKKGLDIGTEGVKKALESAKRLDFNGTADALKDAGSGIESVGKDLKNLFKK